MSLECLGPPGSEAATPDPNRRWPIHGWVGLVLVAVFWAWNWLAPGLRTHWGFFPLWLGYCLTVDALAVRRSGTSLATRSVWGYAALFVISAPAWWLFEVLNARTQNWFYEGRESFTELQFFLFSSLSFSTVIPAVFGTAELAGTLGWIRRMGRGPSLALTRFTPAALFVAGWLMLGLLLRWPVHFFPFLWLSVFGILDPINYWLGNRSLLKYAAAGDWRPLVSLSAGCLACGLFWEMWNYYSYPKWIYRIPFVGVLHVFEMPLLGYGGYVPVAWELFAMYQLIAGLTRRRAAAEYASVCTGPAEG